jgi:uncharacterized protein involved in exopolysaccharide biosynthesis
MADDNDGLPDEKSADKQADEKSDKDADGVIDNDTENLEKMIKEHEEWLIAKLNETLSSHSSAQAVGELREELTATREELAALRSEVGAGHESLKATLAELQPKAPLQETEEQARARLQNAQQSLPPEKPKNPVNWI